MTRLILLGKPGSGKGTQARRIARDAGIPALSTGELMRSAVAAGTEIGRQFRQYIDKGLLVPDTLVLALIQERFAKADCANGYLLDGFPRTVVQAEALEAWLQEQGKPLTAALNIEVPDSALIERAAGRRLCTKCSASYHVKFAPPKVGNTCDTCGAEVAQRSDDRAEVVLARITEYKNKTAPLLGFYRSRQQLCEVDGLGTPDEVTSRIKTTLQQWQGHYR